MKTLTIFILIMLALPVFGQDLTVFSYPHNNNKIDFKLERKGLWKNILEGTLDAFDPISKKSMKVRFNYYQLHSAKKKPLVFVFPSISRAKGTTEIVEQTMATKLSNRGFHVITCHLLDDIADASKPIEAIDNFFIRTIVAYRQVLDQVVQFPEVDRNRLFVMGASLGGIISSLFLSVEPRIKKGYVLVSGGNLPQILTNSEVPVVKIYRKQKIKELGLNSTEDYMDLLSRTLKVEPLEYAAYRRSGDIRMVIAKKDKKVPTANQYMLWEAFGRPTVHIINAGHRVGGGSFIVQMYKAVTFFNKN